MVIGMATVLLFLSLMIVLINLSARLTSGITARELEGIEQEKQARALRAKKKKQQKKAAKTEGEIPMAVFAAAIAAYEADVLNGT